MSDRQPEPDRPRLLVASVQGQKSLPPERVASIRERAEVSFVARDRALGSDELASMLVDVPFLAITPKVCPVLDDGFLAAVPHLEAIALHATGFDFVDTAALARHRVTLSTLPTYSTRSVAEQTIGLLLSLSSRLHLGNDRARGMVPTDTSLRGFELAGRTLGIIGCGRIGGLVARLAQGLGMTTIAYDVDPKPVPGVRYVPLPELLRASHAVTLHRPLAFGDPPMLRDDELSLLPDGAVIVNSSRAALVDDAAIARAIRSGRLRGYAVDDEVFDPRHADLLREGRVLQTGHSAWWTDEVLERGATMWADAIDAMLTGDPTYDTVDVRVHEPAVASGTGVPPGRA